MTNVFHRKSDRTLPMAVRGEGIWLIDDAGNRYLDGGGSGAGMTALGHGNAEIAEAIASQARLLSFIHGALFTTEPLEQLAEELARSAPAGLTRVFFASGGSEANEVALMMAKQVAHEKGEDSRHKIISRRNSFHGATIGLLGVSGDVLRQRPFAALIGDSIKIAPTYGYRDQRIDESDADYGLRVANELDTAIRAAGPETVLAFIAETIGGSSSGALTAPPGYYERVREICDAHGVALVLDEVYCGLGRSGTAHACLQENVIPDYLVVAKGLAAGYAPIGAVVTSESVHKTIANGTGAFRGGFTHSGHTLSCTAALAVQRIVRERGLIANVAQQGARLSTLLLDRFGNHRHVGEVRGRGLLQSIELVADRDSKAPFERTQGIAPAIAREAVKLGLIVNAAQGTVDGVRGDHVLLAPPFIIDSDELATMVERLGDAVDRAVTPLAA